MPDNQVLVEIATGSIALALEDGATLPAYMARPSGHGDYPGLIVLQEAFGVNAHIRDVTERFARRGFVAIAPALFHRTDPEFEGSYTDFASVMPHMQALTDDGQTGDLNACYAWLTAADGGSTNAVCSIGYCMGVRSSFLANAILPLRAAASYYGGGIAPSPQGRFPDLLGRAGQLHAPMLLVWGGLDKHIGPEQRRAVEDALITAGKSYVEAIFSEADHGFSCDARASYNPEATREAWELTLQFFKEHLGAGAPGK